MRLFLPAALKELKILATMDKGLSEALQKLVASNTDDGSVDLANSLGVSPDTASDLVNYLVFLGEVYKDDLVTMDGILYSLRATCTEYKISITNLDLVASLLFAAATRKQRTPGQKKKDFVERGLTGPLIDARTIVELRPIFDGKRDQIESWVTGITLRIGYEDLQGEETAVVLSLDTRSLQLLSDAIETARRKKELLEKRAKEAGLL